MKIILNNNAELNPINVIGGRSNVQGMSRDTLTFVFNADADMAELDSVFSANNCESITIESVDDKGNVTTHIHKGYTVRGEINKAVVRTERETEDAPAVYEERINVVMGQRTYTEAKMAEMEEALNMILSGATGEEG